MKLVVLAGAKKGVSVPLKKDRFTIGRSKECSLRAGSEAISRQHCELRRTDKGVTARDMGSRNGTYVNDEKIEGERLLTTGDTLRVGALVFRFEAEAELSKVKHDKVKSAGEAVARVADKARTGGGPMEEDISDWLLGESTSSEAPAIGETLSMRTDETRQLVEEMAAAAADDQADDAETVDVESAEAVNGKGKKEPGKLPFRPPQDQAKDSREAAAKILRDMARRR